MTMSHSHREFGGPAVLEASGTVGSPQDRAARGPAMKFAYTTGARPLDGFTIKRGVGIGGFGEVYFATSDAGKEVALKRVQRNLDIELRGVSACLNLKHPHLVALYDIKYDDEGQAWVVMEYVNGESLKDVIDRNRNGLPLDEVRAWFTGVAAGVAYLHDHGIVHRDLKPGNLFLDDGTVKVGDYGLSKFISCSRRSGQTESVGTFHYMAPEIGNGSYGREIDIYALGIVLFEMLTGRVPFDGESSQEIIMKHLTADPDVSGLPQPMRDVVARAMRKSPEERFRDVPAMLAALGWSASGAASHPANHQAAMPVAAVVVGAAPIYEINEATVEEPLYIGDDPPPPSSAPPSPAGIEFGEVRQSPPPYVPGPALEGAPEPREPIAQAVSRAAQSLGVWWNDSRLGTPLKVLLLLAVGAAVVFNAGWLAPLAIGAGILYAVYFGIWSLSAAASAPAATTGAPPSHGARGVNYFQRSGSWRASARELLRRRTTSEKLAEWCGSLLMAAIVALGLSVVMVAIGGAPSGGMVDNVAFYVWFATASTLGAWLVLTSGKLLEGQPDEPFRRRFAMLLLGLLFGALAFGVQELLWLRLDSPVDFPHLTNSVRATGAYDSGAFPLLPAYLAYFAGIFVVLRWWKQVDPLRGARLSIWTTGVCLLWGAVLEMFWHFPQPWGLMLVATISISAQLSAPWITPRQREELRDQARLAPVTRH
jgi:serine/threonine protein kinase